MSSLGKQIAIMQKPLKLGYLSGPVDARAIYSSIKTNEPTSLFGTSYLAHLMKICEEDGRDAVIVTTHPGEAYDVQLGSFTILNRPMPTGRFFGYHWKQVRWTRAVLLEMETLGAQTVVLTASQLYWFLTGPFRKRGMLFINAYHCAVRSKALRSLSVHEIFARLTGFMHLRYGDPTLAASPLILRQLMAEPGNDTRKTFYFVPDYDETIFAGCTPNVPSSGTVEVMFAGRVEENKGVFDFLAACEMILSRTDRLFRFHVHGEGSALQDLKERAANSKVADRFVIHGFTAGKDLMKHYAASHIVVVPTRSDFEEGFAMSVVEGVLAFRPVVTSIACPAFEVVTEACEEAVVDDAASYGDRIYELGSNSALASAKIEAAKILRRDFFDPPNGYKPMLRVSLAECEAAAR